MSRRTEEAWATRCRLDRREDRKPPHARTRSARQGALGCALSAVPILTYDRKHQSARREEMNGQDLAICV